RHTRFSRDWSSDVCSSDLDERVLQRRARTLHLGVRAQEYTAATLVCEVRHGFPRSFGFCRAMVDAADAVPADQFLAHAFDQTVLQLHAGGDYEKVEGISLTALRDHLLALRVELGDSFLHQLDACRHVFSGGGDHVAGWLDARAHKREAWLVEVLFARIDYRDLRAVQRSGKA